LGAAGEKNPDEHSPPNSTESACLSSDATSRNMESANNPAGIVGIKKHNYFVRFCHFLKKPKSVLELAALIVLGFYTFYAGRQVKTMNDTLSEIKNRPPLTASISSVRKPLSYVSISSSILSENTP
jgi:hypothetical protein